MDGCESNVTRSASPGGINPPAFAVGQVVRLRADPAMTGAVIQILTGGAEDRYVVYHDGRRATYYASQIEPQALPDERAEAVALGECLARLSARQIRHPSLSTLYSLHAARVNFVPYQFRPVLRFIRSDRPRLLIADEVGVGKTIEAGLILRELQARRDVNSVLIVCPRPLVTERKWELEMRRFDERFVALDGPSLRYCLRETDRDGVWPDKFSRALLPFSLFDERLLNGTAGRSRSVGLEDLSPPPRFDLVIVDEAHHLRNPGTFLHRGVRFFCEHAEAVLFLTATPIQMGSHDLFVLLNLLRPDLVPDRGTFEVMAEPNPHINAAIEAVRAASVGWQSSALEDLKQAAATAWGSTVLSRDPSYVALCDRLPAAASVEDRLAAARDLEELRTFSRLINRTRRRDIGNFTMRKAETVEVPFTPRQQMLHDLLLEIQTQILQRSHGDRSVALMMTTLRRQAASCLYGLAPLAQDILDRHLDEAFWEETDDGAELVSADSIASMKASLCTLMAKAATVDGQDPKLEALLRIIHEKQAMPNPKVLVFSSFRHTLKYLWEKLAGHHLRAGLIHGGVGDDERATLRRRFRSVGDDSVDVLLCSEVGSEGLDYEFCDCLVNYDLPWNPMRIEQRIGRIDRYGQASDTVAIYNLVTPGTVDFDIFERCLLRIGVFRHALGGSEEILGEVTQQLRAVAESLELSPAQCQERLQQLSDNAVRRMQEQEELEERQVELFGLALPPQDLDREIADATSPWLSATALQNLLECYLIRRCGRAGAIRGDGPVRTLRLGQEDRTRLLEDLDASPAGSSELRQQWRQWLKGSEQRLDVCFDAATAGDRRDVAFITPVHPFVQQAAAAAGKAAPAETRCIVRDAHLPRGSHPFAIYEWERIGFRKDAALQAVCEDAAVAADLFHVLQSAEPVDFPPEGPAGPPDFQSLETQHYELWSAARAEHRSQTARLAQFRRESLRTSHRARLALLQEQLGQATDDNIRRMRRSQIARAEADFERRLLEIDSAEQRADIVAEPVAFGVIVVEANG